MVSWMLLVFLLKYKLHPEPSSFNFFFSYGMAVYFCFFCTANIMCPGWSETNKLLRPESPERKGIMSENIYTISGLISHVSSEVKQSPSPNLLRLGVTFPDRLLLSTNEQIGVFMDFTACVPETIATSGKAYCKRIMTDVTRDAEKEQFYCVFSLIRFRSNRNP